MKKTLTESRKILICLMTCLSVLSTEDNISYGMEYQHRTRGTPANTSDDDIRACKFFIKNVQKVAKHLLERTQHFDFGDNQIKALNCISNQDPHPYLEQQDKYVLGINLKHIQRRHLVKQETADKYLKQPVGKLLSDENLIELFGIGIENKKGNDKFLSASVGDFSTFVKNIVFDEKPHFRQLRHEEKKHRYTMEIFLPFNDSIIVVDEQRVFHFFKKGNKENEVKIAIDLDESLKSWTIPTTHASVWMGTASSDPESTFTESNSDSEKSDSMKKKSRTKAHTPKPKEIFVSKSLFSYLKEEGEDTFLQAKKEPKSISSKNEFSSDNSDSEPSDLKNVQKQKEQPLPPQGDKPAQQEQQEQQEPNQISEDTLKEIYNQLVEGSFHEALQLIWNTRNSVGAITDPSFADQLLKQWQQWIQSQNKAITDSNILTILYAELLHCIELHNTSTPLDPTLEKILVTMLPDQTKELFLRNASSQGRLNIVKYLIEECHCNKESKDNNGDTPLNVASQEGHLDIVKYLVEECHCKLEAQNNDGDTSLHGASAAGCLGIVKYLVEEHHCNVEAKNNDGVTPLHYASVAGCLDIVKYLVEEHNCNVESKNKNGDTPLHLASLQGHLGIVKYLVEEHNCDVESKNKNGDTPLHWTSLQGHLDIVKYLVEECHCNKESKDNNGKTPLYWASLQCHLDIVKYLVEECHCNKEPKDKNGDTPLHFASCSGCLNIVKYLVEDCHCNAETKDNYGDTPLHVASHEGHLEIVRYLIEECHCDKDIKDNKGRTPLHFASQEGHLDIVKHLVEDCHCNKEPKDKNGDTPLHYAFKNGYLDIVKYLIEECHCNVEAKNKLGKTPIDVAATEEIRSYLRSKK